MRAKNIDGEMLKYKKREKIHHSFVNVPTDIGILLLHLKLILTVSHMRILLLVSSTLDIGM